MHLNENFLIVNSKKKNPPEVFLDGTEQPQDVLQTQREPT